MGPENARFAVRQLVTNASWDLMISTGFAGDLDGAEVGAILVGQEVSSVPSTSQRPDRRTAIPCHSDWIAKTLSLPGIEQGMLRTAKFVSVDRILIHSVDKQQLRTSTGAEGVDMESAAIGEIAQEYDCPFLIVRTVSDGINHDLPVDFNLFLRSSGWVPGLLKILSTPGSWKGFLDLYRHSKYASRQLTKFFDAFFLSISSGSTVAT